MVALVQRVRKLEKKVADRSQIGRLDDTVIYQPSTEELAEAVAILVECGAVREVDTIGPSDSSSGTWNLVWNFGI
jgi:hypothetical protein